MYAGQAEESRGGLARRVLRRILRAAWLGATWLPLLLSAAWLTVGRIVQFDWFGKAGALHLVARVRTEPFDDWSLSNTGGLPTHRLALLLTDDTVCVGWFTAAFAQRPWNFADFSTNDFYFGAFFRPEVGSDRWRYLGFRLWRILGLTAIPPLLWLILRIRRRLRARRPGLCRACGYDMRGSPNGRCPECGDVAPARASHATRNA